MQVITDEEILYDCYKKLAKNNEARNRKVDLANDKNSVSRIASSTSLMITRLTETDLVIPAQEIQRYILGAKGLFLQCASIKRRHPNCIAESLDRSVDKMIQAVCKHEADMIEGLRQQEKDGDRIDIKMVFDQPRYLKQLGNMSARNIIAEAIDNENRYLSDSPPIYITRTGKKYHVANCPYCRGKDLNQATARIIRDNRLLPCKCVDSTHLQGELEHTFVTAFIDETIHPVNWDEKGNKGKAGSFSYILCWGKVTYESQITDQRLITQSVDYTGEHEHIERITETAIGKVMLSLIYDYNFSGKVRIFSDNQSAVNHWSEVALNSKLAKSFEKVEVIFIPREKNKRADQLGRTRMLLDMPINAYNEMVRKCARLNELENRIRKLAEECKCDVVA